MYSNVFFNCTTFFTFFHFAFFSFSIITSVAILQYLCVKYGLNEWYPTDLQAKAKVDEYLNWQHFNTRMQAASVFRIIVS